MRPSIFFILLMPVSTALPQPSTGTAPEADISFEQQQLELTSKCLQGQITLGMQVPHFGSLLSISDLAHDAAYACSDHGVHYNQKLIDQSYQMVLSSLTPSQRNFYDELTSRMLLRDR